MVAGFLLALREGLEAALIIGLVLGVLDRLGRSDLRRAVWAGVILAAFLSLIAGIVFNAIGAGFEGEIEEVFEAVTMLVAAGVLTWMLFWMQRQKDQVRRAIDMQVQRAAAQGQIWGLFSIAFLAVIREGIETVLFLTAAAIRTSLNEALLGGLMGLFAAAASGWVFFSSARRLNLRLFFQISSVLLLLFAAGLIAHGVHELNEVGWVPTLIAPVWDLNPILDESSALGVFLGTIFGYNGDPSLSEVMAYLFYITLVWLAMRRATRRDGARSGSPIDAAG